MYDQSDGALEQMNEYGDVLLQLSQNFKKYSRVIKCDRVKCFTEISGAENTGVHCGPNPKGIPKMFKHEPFLERSLLLCNCDV